VRAALDAQLTVGTATGIGEYVRGLAGALRARGLDVVELREAGLDPWRFDRRVFWDQVLLPRRARASGAQLLHCASGTMPAASALPIVVTVHDLAWHEAQSHAPLYARLYFGRFSLRQYRRARKVFVDSDFSRRRLLALCDLDPARVEVLYPGVADDFSTVRRQSDGRTILAVGTVEPRKNLEVLVRALSKLQAARVIAVGPHTPYAGECATLAQRLGVAQRLEMPGYVSREQLLALYGSCAAAAVPSLYEGFGYAAAQALCAGVPCVVSDRSSLPEIAGSDARVVAAQDPGAWADALTSALNSRDEPTTELARARCIARFSWADGALTAQRAYESIDG